MKSDGSSGAPPVTDEREADRRAQLRAQPWARLLKQLTAIAFKRINGRSMADAQDYASTAIAAAYESVARGGWDPERGQLLSYLVARTITAAGAERRRKRSTCEVWLDEEAEDENDHHTVSPHEKQLADDKPAPDAALHRLRFASTFEERLVARLADDPLSLAAIPFMKEGLYTPEDLAVATGKSDKEMRDALRRIRYHAREIIKELSAHVVTLQDGGSRTNEVTQ